MAQAQPFRVAHLTDLHVASSWQPVVDAMAIIATSVPALHFAAPMLNDAVNKLSPNTTLPAKTFLGVAGAAGAVWALSRSQKVRSMAKVFLAMTYQYNHSAASRRRRLFESLKQNGIQHLVITGDLTITAHPAEFRKICEELDGFGFDRGNTTVVPGNHDRIMFPRSEPFETFFPEVTFPDVREIAPGIIIAGLDSNVPSDKWSFGDLISASTRGYIDLDQIRILESKLDGITDEFVVTGIHHLPMQRRRIIKCVPEPLRKTYFDEPEHSKEFRKLARKLDTLVLCGHDHPKQSRVVKCEGLNFYQGKASGLRFQNKTTYDIYDLYPGRKAHRLTATV